MRWVTALPNIREHNHGFGTHFPKISGVNSVLMLIREHDNITASSDLVHSDNFLGLFETERFVDRRQLRETHTETCSRYADKHGPVALW